MTLLNISVIVSVNSLFTYSQVQYTAPFVIDGVSIKEGCRPALSVNSCCRCRRRCRCRCRCCCQYPLLPGRLLAADFCRRCHHQCVCAHVCVPVGMVTELVRLTGEVSVTSSFWFGKAERSSFHSGCRFLYTCEPRPLATLTLVWSKVLAHVVCYLCDAVAAFYASYLVSPHKGWGYCSLESWADAQCHHSRLHPIVHTLCCKPSFPLTVIEWAHEPVNICFANNWVLSLVILSHFAFRQLEAIWPVPGSGTSTSCVCLFVGIFQLYWSILLELLWKVCSSAFWSCVKISAANAAKDELFKRHAMRLISDNSASNGGSGMRH